MDIMLGQWRNGSTSDAAEAYSIPVFMLMQAVDDMAEAKKLGKQEKNTEDQERKRKEDFILLIISVVLVISSGRSPKSPYFFLPSRLRS